MELDALAQCSDVEFVGGVAAAHDVPAQFGQIGQGTGCGDEFGVAFVGAQGHVTLGHEADVECGLAVAEGWRAGGAIGFEIQGIDYHAINAVQWRQREAPP